MSKEVLQIAEKRRQGKGKGEKERYTHLNAEFQRIAQRDKKAFLGTLLHCWWECKLVQPLWRTVWRFLKKLEIDLP